MKEIINTTKYKIKLKYNRIYLKKEKNLYINKTSKDRYMNIYITPKTDIYIGLKNNIVGWINYDMRLYLSDNNNILYKNNTEKIIIKINVDQSIDINNLFNIKLYDEICDANRIEKIQKEIKKNNKKIYSILKQESNESINSDIEKYLKISTKKKKVIYIGDEATFLGLKDIYEIYNIQKNEVHNFMNLIDEYVNEISIPEILFIESFWNGKNNTWTFREKETNEFFIEILIDKLKKFGTKIVFYNKEDPYHYKDFLWLAQYSDIIITVDKDKVCEYKEKFPNKKVIYNSFIINEKIFNAYSTETKIDKIYFAGNYYNNRFKKRKIFLNNLFNYIDEKNIEFEIIDRSYNISNTTFGFPKIYDKFIKTGGFSIIELNEYIKKFKYGINVNSITETNSFVSRRLLEHITLGKIMISNYSKAVERLNNTSIIYSSNDDVLEIFEKIKNRKISDEELINNSMKILIEYGSFKFEKRLNYELFGKKYTFVVNEESIEKFKKENIPFEYELKIQDKKIEKIEIEENKCYIPKEILKNQNNKEELIKSIIEVYIKGV